MRISRYLSLLLVTAFMSFAVAENAPEADPADAPDAPAAAPEPAGQQAEAPAPADEPVTAQANPSPAPNADAGGREDALQNRIKELVKKFDKFNRSGGDFPIPALETAFRTEFMRHADGKSWIGKRHSKDADKNMALDNLDLLVTYTDKVLATVKAKKKYTPKDLEQLKVMAAKSVVDDYNRNRPAAGREVASLTTRPTGLSTSGKNEHARRKKLLAGLVTGGDYKAFEVKKIEDIGKQYKERLLASTKAYESFAKEMSVASSGGSKKSTKKKKR